MARRSTVSPMESVARAKVTRPLMCHACGAGSERLVVETGQTKVRYKGKVRIRVNVHCTNCGNEWQSVHANALALAKRRDQDFLADALTPTRRDRPRLTVPPPAAKRRAS